MDNNAAGEAVEVLFNYVLGVPFIPEDVYNLIKAFFNHYNSIPNSGLERFWMKAIRPADLPKFYAQIRDTQRNLLNKVVQPGNDQRTTMILTQLCIMIYVHPEYHNAMQHIQNGKQFEEEFQLRIMEILLQQFYRQSFIDLSNEYFIRNLREFMYYRKTGNGQNIHSILAYVIRVFICCCFPMMSISVSCEPFPL